MKQTTTTNKDLKCKWRVLHRQLKLRTWKDKDAPCRMCEEGRDTFSHWHECPTIQAIFSTITPDPQPPMIYLGLTEDLTPLTGARATMHALLWKYTIIQFTQVDTDNKRMNVAKIELHAKRRLLSRLKAYGHQASKAILRSRSKGDHKEQEYIRHYNKHLEPYAELNHQGNLILSDKLKNFLLANHIHSSLPSKEIPDAHTRTAKIPHDYPRQETSYNPKWNGIIIRQTRPSRWKKEHQSNWQYVRNKYR